MLQKNEELFKCPLCSLKMRMNTSGSFVCQAGHTFDLSRKGHLNLLLSSSPPAYAKELFEARRRVCDAGFYDPFLHAFANTIQAFPQPENHGLVMLDAGCGEGSHLHGISMLLKAEQKRCLIGVDISKESIQLASSMESDILWCVSDLAKLPFQDASFDMILNILSPANYSEFSRLLKADGKVLKVVPGPHYLREIREAVYQGTPKNEYSGEDILEHFSQKLKVLDTRNVHYTFEADPSLLPDIIRMTPMTRDVHNIEALKLTIQKVITVDLNILIGEKRTN